MTRYVVDKKKISHDRLQDEVIIINVATGSYYSGSGPAADLWTLVIQGASVTEAAIKLASVYACKIDDVVKDIGKCVDSFVARGLIEEADASFAPPTELILPPAIRGTWIAPEFDEYTDMWDLIKLDPIHDADEVGWPTAKP